MQFNLLALALSIATAEAAYKGFNYGATNGDGSTRSKADYTAQFQTAKGLVGAEDMTSARLYTMIQGGSTNTPIEAIEAAIEEKTTLLLGLWTSGGGIDNEVAALKNAINQYGDDFAKLVVGISVGSEDLYRNSPTGIKANSGPGMNPDDLVSAIKAVRSAVSGTALGSAPIGHVDTWNDWTNGSNSAVIDAVDFLGFDTYPFYQTTDDNSIDNAANLFEEAMQKTKAAANGKEIWVTESGWPVSGPSTGAAEASIPNAKKFWDQVACKLFSSDINTWWYILQDAGASPSFGVVGDTLTTTPLYDLSCSNTGSNSTSSSSASGSATSSGAAGSSSTPLIQSSGGAAGGSGASASASMTSSAAAGGASSSAFRTSAVSSTPLMTSPAATGTASAGAGSGSSSGSGSGAGAVGSGSSGAGSTGSGSGSGSGSSSAPSASATAQYNAAARPAGSIFGAVVAAFALAIIV